MARTSTIFTNDDDPLLTRPVGDGGEVGGQTAPPVYEFGHLDFNPQPEPPPGGLDFSIYSFNPQPEPPAVFDGMESII